MCVPSSVTYYEKYAMATPKGIAWHGRINDQLIEDAPAHALPTCVDLVIISAVHFYRSSNANGHVYPMDMNMWPFIDLGPGFLDLQYFGYFKTS